MKKSVIFLIGIIYLVSIVIVTFFGMQIAIDQFKIYMTEIEITNQECRMIDGEKYIIVEFDSVQGYTSIFIDYETAPDNASNPEKISFRISGNEFVDGEGNVSIYATVTDNGEVTFTRPGQVVVTVSTEDGSRLSDTVNILCKKPRQ